MLKIDKLNLKFKSNGFTKNLFNDFDLSIDKGEFICILGPSGCGKSSLLNILAGFEKSYTGSVLLNGEKILKPDIKRAIVFQDYALFPWLNVIENVSFGLKKSIPNRQECFMQAIRYLELVDLVEHSRARIHELSGGMQQRVAIARALAVRPEILLLDEPLGALDDWSRRNLQNELIKIWTELQQTILFVTHSVDEALLLASRIVVMNVNSEKVLDIQLKAEHPRKLDHPECVKIRLLIKEALSQKLKKNTQKSSTQSSSSNNIFDPTI
ncbi:MAG: ABC transporter ATP-binding protein [bacterium]